MFVCFLNSSEIVETDEPGYEEVELQHNHGFNRGDPNYESLHYSVHSASDPPYAQVEKLDRADESPEGVPETINNNIDIPVYAQVMKPKRTTSENPIIPLINEPVELNALRTIHVNDQDLSVSSSKNTTIIRITDSRSRYFPDDGTFGTPEQV